MKTTNQNELILTHEDLKTNETKNKINHIAAEMIDSSAAKWENRFELVNTKNQKLIKRFMKTAKAVVSLIWDFLWDTDGMSYPWQSYIGNQNSGTNQLMAYRIENGEVKFFK